MLELILGTLLGRFLPEMTRFKGSLDISLDKIGLSTVIQLKNFFLVSGRENKGEWFGMRYLLSAIPRIFFQPTKIDNFKDEKNSDYKTVSILKNKQKKKLAGLKIVGLVGL